MYPFLLMSTVICKVSFIFDIPVFVKLRKVRISRAEWAVSFETGATKEEVLSKPLDNSASKSVLDNRCRILTV